MKKTLSVLSILTILSLVCTTGCRGRAKNVPAEARSEIVEVKTPAEQAKAELAKAEERVMLPAENEADFNKQIANGIVILDFFAVWCPPCKRFGPIFANAAREAINSNKLFIKIDVEKYEELRNRYSVQSMPTIIALKDGEEIKRHIGGMSEKEFKNWLNNLAK